LIRDNLHDFADEIRVDADEVLEIWQDL